MNPNLRIAVLHRVFLALYRSFGQYIRDAGSFFDVGEPVVRELIERQRADAERLGRMLADETGSLHTGAYPTEFGDVHFLNFSRVLTDWLPEQRKLIAELESLRASVAGLADTSTGLIDDILAHERDCLSKLEAIATPTAVG